MALFGVYVIRKHAWGNVPFPAHMMLPNDDLYASYSTSLDIIYDSFLRDIIKYSDFIVLI